MSRRKRPTLGGCDPLVHQLEGLAEHSVSSSVGSLFNFQYFLTTFYVFKSETPEDIASKWRKDTSGTQLYRHANFQADRPHRRRDMSPHTKTELRTADEISDKTHTSVAFAG